MIKKLYFCFTILILLSINCLAKVFVPSGNGFIEKKINIENQSINNVRQYLGYNSEQAYSYMDFNKIDEGIISVVFKVFSESIICVITKDEVTTLTKDKVDNFLAKFSLKKEYNPYKIESILNNGIKNKSLTSKFLGELFNKGDIDKNGTFVVHEIGYVLHFTDGTLTKFSASDGLNKWAKEWKLQNREIFTKYEEFAKKYWGDNKVKILEEINTQAEAYSRTPEAAGNEYIEFHRSSEGVINFKMIMVVHYNEKINLAEFKDINFGRYELIREFNDSSGYKRTTYKVNKSLFTFSEKGELVNSYTSK